MYLTYPDILTCLNKYLPKKSATVLLGVSKSTHKYIFPKKYRDKMLLLDTSDLAKIKMFIESNAVDCTFYHLFNNLTRFKYITTRFHHWNKYHWVYVNTFLIYRYMYREFDTTVFPFLGPYHFYVSLDLINFLEVVLPIDIHFIFEACLVYPFQNVRELIML